MSMPLTSPRPKRRWCRWPRVSRLHTFLQAPSWVRDYGSPHNLATKLSAVGQRGEAPQPAQEAVSIYRELAGKNPDAFLPDLARSLGAMGSVCRGLGRHVEALHHFEEGALLLHPCFEKSPRAFVHLLRSRLGDTLALLQACGQEPSGDLLKVLRAFDSIRLCGGAANGRGRVTNRG